MTAPLPRWRAHAPLWLLLAGALVTHSALGGFLSLGRIRDALPDPALTLPLSLGFALLWSGYLGVAVVRVRPARWLLAFYVAVLLVVFLVTPSVLSIDLLDYIRRGRVLSVHGANPHVTTPSSFPDDPFYSDIGWTFLTTAYGPAFTLLSGALTWLAGDGALANIILFKLAMTAAHLANFFLVRRITESERAALLYLCNPFILLETVASAHNDVLAVTAVLASLRAIQRGSPVLSAIFLSLAAWIKIPFAALFAVWLRYTVAAQPRPAAMRTALRGVAAAALVTVALWLPFYAGTTVLHVYRIHAGLQTKWSTPALVSAALSRAGIDHAPNVVGFICLAAAALCALPSVLRARSLELYERALAVVLLVLPLLGMGWLLPWYLVWSLSLVPLVAGPTWTAMGLALTAGGFANYVQQTYLGFASRLTENAVLGATSIAPPFAVLLLSRLLFASRAKTTVDERSGTSSKL